MSDLPARLRLFPKDQPVVEVQRLRLEAADELDRMQTDLDTLKAAVIRVSEAMHAYEIFHAPAWASAQRAIDRALGKE